tara:strand:- start:5673 stop:6440 length:768 start_codon:yes stop_codon:yes gene_type:complete
MAEDSIIAWTDHTFNPWMGCVKVSDGCTNCYAETLTSGRMGLDLWGLNGKRQRTTPANWNKVRRWHRDAQAAGQSLRVFCASLCDLFEGREDTDRWLADLWNLIRETPGLDWQLLTKRPENIVDRLPADWGDGWPNVWLGTSIEDWRVADRAKVLAQVPAQTRFVSYEPAIGPLAQAIDLFDIDWVIYGGESGPGYRHEDKQWARDMHLECKAVGAAFFHKQSAGHRTELGIELDGVIVRDYPRPLRRLSEEDLF